MITVNETFSGARDYPLTGKFFKLLGSGAPVDVAFTGDGGPDDIASQITQGFRCKLPFLRVRVTPTGTDTIKFIISDDEAGQDSFVVVKPTGISTIADVALNAGAATQVLPADGTRQQALITNLAGNANAIRVGDSNVAAARGVQVAAGQTITLAGTQAIFAFSAGGQSVGITTVKD